MRPILGVCVGAGSGEVGTGDVCLEPKAVAGQGGDGGISSLVKNSLFWGKQKPPQALTGSLLVGHGPSLIPASPVITGR